MEVKRSMNNCLCADAIFQVWWWLHHHPPPDRQSIRPGLVLHQRLYEEVISQHRAEGAPPERAAVPAALTCLLPGSCLWCAGQQPRRARHHRLLRFTDHPGPGEEGDTPRMKAFEHYIYLKCWCPERGSSLNTTKQSPASIPDTLKWGNVSVVQVILFPITLQKLSLYNVVFHWACSHPGKGRIICS